MRLTDYIFKRKIRVLLTEKEKELEKRFEEEKEKWKSILEKGEDFGLVKAFSQYFTYSNEYFFDNVVENYPVSEGDIITIKTLKKQDGGFYFFFFTFLIELDPL